MTMKISKPEIVREGNQVIYRVEVQSNQGKRTLWYNLHKSYGDFLSTLSDAPLVALLIPAMANGEDIYIEGTVSERLLYNLSRSIQKILQLHYPSLHLINIHADDAYVDQHGRAPGVATGFSGGVDSFFTLADHYYSPVPNGFKITHLLFNNVGSHGPGSSGEHLFQERYERLASTAEILGLPLLKINSNLDSFYTDEFHQSHTLRNASVALLLQNGIGRYMYSSSGLNISEFGIARSEYLSRIDPIITPILCTDALDLFLVGGEYTRLEKTLRVAEISESYGTLDVCIKTGNHDVSDHQNCSTCSKCLRTLATLDIAGYLERYSASFDLAAYKIHRDKYFATLLGSTHPSMQDIAKFANERNYSFPVSSHAIRAYRASGIYRILPLGKLLKLMKFRNPDS